MAHRKRRCIPIRIRRGLGFRTALRTTDTCVGTYSCGAATTSLQREPKLHLDPSSVKAVRMILLPGIIGIRTGLPEPGGHVYAHNFDRARGHVRVLSDSPCPHIGCAMLDVTIEDTSPTPCDAPGPPRVPLVEHRRTDGSTIKGACIRRRGLGTLQHQLFLDSSTTMLPALFLAILAILPFSCGRPIMHYALASRAPDEGEGIIQGSPSNFSGSHGHGVPAERSSETKRSGIEALFSAVMDTSAARSSGADEHFWMNELDEPPVYSVAVDDV